MQKNKIELEELLRLKRAECPSDADWERFDSELRGRLLKEAVSGRFNFGIIKGALSAVSLLAVFVGTSFCFYQYFSVDFADDFSSAEHSPLPKLKASYAQNELSMMQSSGEPIFVQMENSPLAMSDNTIFDDSLSSFVVQSF